MAVAVTKRGANNLPIVVQKTITYLTENGIGFGSTLLLLLCSNNKWLEFLDEKLFKEANTAKIIEFYIDQYDQGYYYYILYIVVLWN